MKEEATYRPPSYEPTIPVEMQNTTQETLSVWISRALMRVSQEAGGEGLSVNLSHLLCDWILSPIDSYHLGSNSSALCSLPHAPPQTA